MKFILPFMFKKNNFKITKLNCLSPDGRDQCPQMVYIAKGAWFNKVRINQNSFSTGNPGEAFGKRNNNNSSSSIIIFPANNTDDSRSEEIIQKTESFFRTYDNKEIGGKFSIGNYFTGTYCDEQENNYNEKSLCIEVKEVPLKKLFGIAAKLAESINQQTTLINDLNKNKFYIIERK